MIDEIKREKGIEIAKFTLIYIFIVWIHTNEGLEETNFQSLLIWTGLLYGAFWQQTRESLQFYQDKLVYKWSLKTTELYLKDIYKVEDVKVVIKHPRQLTKETYYYYYVFYTGAHQEAFRVKHDFVKYQRSFQELLGSLEVVKKY